MGRIEYVDNQPKYSVASAIPDAGTSRVSVPYFKEDNWKYKDETTELNLVPFESFRSAETAFVNGAGVSFAHGWTGFDPVTDWYQVEAWAVCTVDQAGWVVGDRVMLNGRRATISITATNINLQIGANGISVGRKSGNLNEFNLNTARWLVYVQGIRRVD